MSNAHVNHSPYLFKPRTRKKVEKPNELEQLVRTLPHGYEVEKSLPRVPLGAHVVVNGKGCRVGHLRKIIQPRVGGPTYVRGSVYRESLPLVEYHLFIVEIEDRVRDTYVLPSQVLHAFLFGVALRSTRKNDLGVRVANFPYPANPLSRFEPYRNAWHLLT